MAGGQSLLEYAALTALRRKQIKTTVATVVGAILLLSDLILKVPEAIQKLVAQGPDWVSDPRVWTGVVIVGITGLVIWLIWKKPDPEEIQDQLAAVTSPKSQFAMTENEKQQFQQGVIVFRGEAILNFGSSGDPSIVFVFWLFNGCPFSIYLKKALSGHAKFGNDLLSGIPELVNEPQDVSARDRYKFTIRHWISQASARSIIDMINGGGRADFHFHELTMTVASHEPGLENIERRFDLPTLSNVHSNKWGILWE